MEKLIIPEHYQSSLDLHETQIAIKTVKDFFQNLLHIIPPKFNFSYPAPAGS